jgi:hypothetical protein
VALLPGWQSRGLIGLKAISDSSLRRCWWHSTTASGWTSTSTGRSTPYIRFDRIGDYATDRSGSRPAPDRQRE